jgi:hypothetical protein
MTFARWQNSMPKRHFLALSLSLSHSTLFLSISLSLSISHSLSPFSLYISLSLSLSLPPLTLSLSFVRAAVQLLLTYDLLFKRNTHEDEEEEQFALVVDKCKHSKVYVFAMQTFIYSAWGEGLMRGLVETSTIFTKHLGILDLTLSPIE